jgi:hypothetical protein
MPRGQPRPIFLPAADLRGNLGVEASEERVPGAWLSMSFRMLHEEAHAETSEGQ